MFRNVLVALHEGCISLHSNNVTVKRPLARRVDRDIRWNVCNETQVQDPTLLEGW